MNPQARPLTEAEQTFAAGVVEFGELVERLQRSAAQVKAEDGDAQFAVLSTITDENEQKLLRANWPMLALVFGL
jgi:hypothetical protein